MFLVTDKILKKWVWRRAISVNRYQRAILDYELRVIHGVLIQKGFMLSDIATTELSEKYLFDLLDVLHKNLTKQQSVENS